MYMLINFDFDFFSLIILLKNTLLDLDSIPNEKYFSLALFEGHLYTFSIIAVNPGFPRHLL